MSICCFTGHRDLDGKAREIYRRTYDAVENCIAQGYDEFRAGGALGFDTLAAMVVLELKKKYPQVRLVLYLPCREQEKYWTTENKARYAAILEQADEVKILSDHYYRGCMFVRNRAMVEGSDLCIAYLRSGGGTKMTVDYAKKKNVTIINMGEEI